MNSFGARLRQLRKQKDLSQEEVSKVLGYSRVQVSNWEIERSEPDIQALSSLAKFYGVTVDYITCKVGSPTDELVPERPASPEDFMVENIGETFPVPEQISLPIIGTVRAGPCGIAFEDHQGFATVDQGSIPAGSRHFYLRVKGESMSPEIMPGDLALVREQPEVEYGELAVVIVDGEEGTIKRVFPRNGEVFLQATNPSYNRTEKADNVKIVGKVKKTVREY